jgi:hypothetical protein
MKRLPFRDLRAGSHASGWERTRWRNHSHKLWPPKSGAKQLRAKQMTSGCRRIRYELASRHRPFPEVAVANVPMRVIASLHQTKGEQLLHNTTLPAAHNRCTAMCRLIKHALAPAVLPLACIRRRSGNADAWSCCSAPSCGQHHDRQAALHRGYPRSVIR